MPKPVDVTIHTRVDEKRYMPTQITRSGFFFPLTKALRIDKPIEREVWGAVVKQDVMLLTPKHAQVLIGVLKLIQLANGSTVKTTVYQLCKTVFGRGDGASEYNRMRVLLRDLTKVWVSLSFTLKGERLVMDSFMVRTILNEDTGDILINVNTLLAKLLLEKRITRLDGKLFGKMRSRTGPLLYMFYLSQQEFYNPPHKFQINEAALHSVLGMDKVAELQQLSPSQSRRYVDRGHKELEKTGVIEKWRFDDKRRTYHVYAPRPKAKKPGLPRASKDNALARQLQDAYKAEGWPDGEKLTQFIKAANRLQDFIETNKNRLSERYRLPSLLVPKLINALRAGRSVEHAGWLTQNIFWDEFEQYLIDTRCMENARPAGYRYAHFGR